MKKDHQEVPIKCTGIAAVLLKKCNDECKVLLLKRAAPPLKDAWCYKFRSMAVISRSKRNRFTRK
ncbi:hypothetical protein ACE3MS_30360 [Paenibacillus dendritiformis]|uniref:hypothetical protein n=1 Tax=Paenibacillus dendritiformis TaxID=130049 RepID=UPI003665152A